MRPLKRVLPLNWTNTLVQDARMVSLEGWDGRGSISTPGCILAKVKPTPLEGAAEIVVVSDNVGRSLGFNKDDLESKEFIEMVSGNSVSPGSCPHALRYHGFQFGQYAGQLGDGRAVCLGEVSPRINAGTSIHSTRKTSDSGSIINGTDSKINDTDSKINDCDSKTNDCDSKTNDGDRNTNDADSKTNDCDSKINDSDIKINDNDNDSKTNDSVTETNESGICHADHQKYEKYELQLKGAGTTPYSRVFDGRATLVSSLREFMCSESMWALGVPTSRALSLVTSKEHFIDRNQPEQVGVVCRVSPTWLRFGCFEALYYSEENELLRDLADFTIEHYFPEISLFDEDIRFEKWFEAVVSRSAQLVAHWESVGFVHGVLNTDNCSIIGVTIDYGPFGFLQELCDFVPNSTDVAGRYSYRNQRRAILWNLFKLAQALSPILDWQKVVGCLEGFEQEVDAKYYSLMGKRMGLDANEKGIALIKEFIEILEKTELDYTLALRSLSGALPRELETFSIPFDSEVWRDWYVEYESIKSFKGHTPLYIPRNHHLASVADKAKQGDYQSVSEYLKVLSDPFSVHPEFIHYAVPSSEPPKPLSCSS